MKNIKKKKFKHEVGKAIMLSNKAGLENYGLFTITPVEGVEVSFKYCGRLGYNHMFSMIDLHDPYSGKNHGYPKLWEGDVDSFYAEFKRELNYIISIHKDKQYSN